MKAKVLIVDDEKDLRELLAAVPCKNAFRRTPPTWCCWT
jgi:DNA-binding response OmpR family regulator